MFLCQSFKNLVPGGSIQLANQMMCPYSGCQVTAQDRNWLLVWITLGKGKALPPIKTLCQGEQLS